MIWGVVPAAGAGSRMQPLAFSKELLPVGSVVERGLERPRAISEYLVERLVLGGATRLCFVIAPGKSDIVEYYGAGTDSVPICYVVQPAPTGLCDALFRALPLTDPEDDLLVGLPDTVWFPTDGLADLPPGGLTFLCFLVERPELFDAVLCDEGGHVRAVQVKDQAPQSHWVWGAFKMGARTARELHQLWVERGRRDEYVGTLVNAWLARGGRAMAVCTGQDYVDTGTVDGYRAAMSLLERASASERFVARIANGPRQAPGVTP